MPLIQHVPPIEGGCHYALEVAVSCNGSGPFTAGTPIIARLRDYEDAGIVAVLSTATGTLVVVDDQTLELQIPGSITARLSETSALIQLMADGPDPDALGITLRLPVIPLGRAVLGSSTAVIMSMLDISLSRCARRTIAAAITVAPAIIAANLVVGTPSLTSTTPLAVAPAPIVATTVVPAPKLSVIAGQQISPAAIGPTTVVGSPTVGLVGAQVVTPAVIASRTMVNAPTIATAGNTGEPVGYAILLGSDGQQLTGTDNSLLLGKA